MKSQNFVIFDNGGATLDRYTVIDQNGEMLGLSDNPNHPQGFSQFCGNCVDNVMFHSYGASWRRHCNVGAVLKNELPRIISEFEREGHIGKRIEFADLPEELQRHIISRFKDN